MTQDEQYLRLISIFHYVVAGMAALFSLFPTVHLVLGILFVSGALKDAQDPMVFPLVGWVFIVFASMWILCGLTFSTCVFVAGRNIGARRRYTFCLAMACLECMFMPFGTILGIFTIIFLLKDKVKAQFGVAVPEAGLSNEKPGT